MRIETVSTPAIAAKNLFQDVAISENENRISFGDMLTSALHEVNDLQKTAEQKNLDLIAGKVEDISEVMVAAEKATIALQLTNQVRTRVVEAYQEIMRMSM